jgi:hypothetical protein
MQSTIAARPAKLISALLVVAMVTGCAASPERFYADPSSISDTQLCRTFLTSAVGTDVKFAADVRNSAGLRGLSYERCQAMVNRQNVQIGAGALLGAAIIAVARNGSSNTSVGVGVGVGLGGDAVERAGPVYDSQWEWDEYTDAERRLVWACRGVQSGHISETYHCADKPQADLRWPQK